MKLTTLLPALLSVCLCQSAASSRRGRDPFGKSALQRRRRLGMDRTPFPTAAPTTSTPPSSSPTGMLSSQPSLTLSQVPSAAPTIAPTISTPPSQAPSVVPSALPSASSAPSVTQKGPPKTDPPTLAPVTPENPSTVDLDPFVMTVAATDLDTDALTTVLTDYLFDGLYEMYAKSLESVELTLVGGRRLVAQETKDLKYTGEVVFAENSAPSAAEVTALQLTLLADTDAVQEAIEQDPMVGGDVVVSAIEVPKDNDKSSSSSSKSVAGLAAGVAAGGLVALILLGVFVARRRQLELDKSPPPPPPPLEEELGEGEDKGDIIRIVSISSKDEEDGVELGEQLTAETSGAVGIGVTGMIQAILDNNKEEKPGSDKVLIRTVSEDDSMDGYSLSSGKPPDAAVAPVLRPSSGEPEEKKADEEQNLAPAGSEDESMDGYSLGSGKRIPVNKWILKPAEQQKKADDYNSDSESQFTYEAIGEASVISQDALTGVVGDSSFNPYGDDEGVEVDNEMLLSNADGASKKSLVTGIFSNRSSSQSKKQPIYRMAQDEEDDPLREAAAASSGEPKIERNLSLPSDEAQDDEDRDLDAFAEQLEKAKAGARMSISKPSPAAKTPTPVKKRPAMRPPDGADDEALNDYLRDTRRSTRESRARNRRNTPVDEV